MSTDPVSPDITALAMKIRQVLCMTDEYERNGAREIPLLDYWGDIEELIEKALKVEPNTLNLLGEGAACADPDCYHCQENQAT